MNFVNGKIVSLEESQEIVNNLDSLISATLQNRNLSLEIVISACDRLSQTLDINHHINILLDLGISKELAIEYINEAKLMLSRDWLTQKVVVELGENAFQSKEYVPPYFDKKITEKIIPLGVLFHIAAGNMDGLPVFTIIEGLLAGNINLVKLPSEEGGLTVLILQELLKIEPLLAPYIYVFDYSSKDLESMQKLAAISDAVVVWGGDTVVKAVRSFATPNTKIIEWGHKISFAYITKQGATYENLELLAQGICKSNQLLCSSCQGIYYDSDNIDEIYEFAERFLLILEKVSLTNKLDVGIGIRSQVGLKLYTEELESIDTKSKIFKGNDCSLIVYNDNQLTTSIMFRNVWIKRLTRNKIVETLKPYKNYLQSAALLASDAEYLELENLLFNSGIEKISNGLDMSKVFCGAAHDGEYPLRRYTKIVYSSK